MLFTKQRFPLDDLQKMPQLRWFMLQMTQIQDSMFQDSNFSELVLPELEYLHFTGGSLTKVPIFPEAPKLRNVRFAYHPLDFITPFAFDHLISLDVGVFMISLHMKRQILLSQIS